MATSVVFNGVTYQIPVEGDSGWGPDLTNFFISIASNSLQKTAGNFPLTAELNFGSSFGLKLPYIKSSVTNPASTGFMRLGNAQGIAWRNATNTFDLTLQVDAGNNLNFNGTSLSVGGDPVQTQLNFNDTQTIDLDLTGADVTANIVAASITNAMINASAAIATSKLAAVTGDRALVSNGGGFMIASAITAVELGYLSGVTSSIQTQIDSKISKSVLAAKGDILTATAAGIPAKVSLSGNTGYILTEDPTAPAGLAFKVAPSGIPPITPGTDQGKALIINGSDQPAWTSIPAAYVKATFGSVGTPRTIALATGITSGASHMSTTADIQSVFAKGPSAGQGDVTANPQIQAHTVVGAVMNLFGGNTTDVFTLKNGNGLLLNGDWDSTSGRVLQLIWNGSVWQEIVGRS